MFHRNDGVGGVGWFGAGAVRGDVCSGVRGFAGMAALGVRGGSAAARYGAMGAAGFGVSPE